MDLSSLKPALGSVKTRKRIGRGPGSGLGGTSTRGHKGAKSRSGYSRKIGFEGGQMPLQRRLPKYGEMHVCRPNVYKAINLSDIQAICDAKGQDVVNKELLVSCGLASASDNIKVLGNGTLSAKVKVEAAAFSKSAVAAIEAAGGSVEIKK